MTVIIAIKPEFAKLILSGKKLFEYRKIVPKEPIDKVLIYASTPIRKIVGEFQIQNIISGTPQQVWKKTGSDSGISKEYFFDYFKRKLIAYAICVKNVVAYNKPIEPNKLIPSFKAPQSFMYIRNNQSTNNET